MRNGKSRVLRNLRKPFLEQEGAEVRDCVDAVFESDVAIRDFHSKGNVRVMVGLNQRSKGFGSSVCRLDLDWHDVGLRTQKEVLFKLGIFASEVAEVAAGFFDCLGDNVLEKASLVGVDVAMGADVSGSSGKFRQ